MNDIEQRMPKLKYRMQRELLEALRGWAENRGISVTSALTLLAQGLIDGRITIDAHSIGQARETPKAPRVPRVPSWMQAPEEDRP